MLRDDIERYSLLTGVDGWDVPISKVGAYLDGYNKGSEVLDKIKTEIIEVYCDRPHTYDHPQRTELYSEVMEIINKYKSESEE